MLNNDVLELYKVCEDQVNTIAQQVDSNQLNKVLLKNTLENMRSILDYISIDIHNRLPQNHKKKAKAYFPYALNHERFKNSMRRNFPALKHYELEIYNLIESIQPFHSNDSWLIDLCTLTNEVKHNNLSGLTKIQKPATVQDPLFGEFNVINMTSHGNVIIDGSYTCKPMEPIDIKEGKLLSAPTQDGSIVIENSKIVFSGKQLDVKEFITECHHNIGMFINNISELLC